MFKLTAALILRTILRVWTELNICETNIWESCLPFVKIRIIQLSLKKTCAWIFLNMLEPIFGSRNMIFAISEAWTDSGWHVAVEAIWNFHLLSSMWHISHLTISSVPCGMCLMSLMGHFPFCKEKIQPGDSWTGNFTSNNSTCHFAKIPGRVPLLVLVVVMLVIVIVLAC